MITLTPPNRTRPRWSKKLLLSVSSILACVFHLVWERASFHLDGTKIAYAGRAATLPVQGKGRAQVGPLCPGCMLATGETAGGRNVRCGSEVWINVSSSARKPKVSLDSLWDDDTSAVVREAGIDAARKYPDVCGRCRPDACGGGEDERTYFRYDDVGPRSSGGGARTRTLPILPSVPPGRRLPPRAVRDPVRFFSNMSNLHNNRSYLFDYNPSIVRIQDRQVPAHLLHEGIAYLASVRVSAHTSAFAGRLSTVATRDGPRKRPDNYVGLALLRDDFSIVESSVFPGPSGDRTDFRLYNFNGHLYLTYYTLITRISLVNSTDPPLMTSGPGAEFKVVRDAFDETRPLRLRMGRPTKACCGNHCEGKNFNYFEAPLMNGLIVLDEVWVETLPHGPHIVERVSFQDCPDQGSNSSSVSNNDTFIDVRSVNASFANVDELYLPKHGYFQPAFIPVNRGTACCVKIDHPREPGEVLLVGISHTKVGFWFSGDNKKFGLNVTPRQYMSRFYAFGARPPFRTVAVSGGFCFPHSSRNEWKENHLVNLTLDPSASFSMDDSSVTDCPHITFPMSIIDSVRPTFVVISYGINDATSRIIEVTKTELTRLLFHGQ